MINWDKTTAACCALIVAQIGVIVYFIRKNRMKTKLAAAQQVATPETTYKELRQIALSVTPYQLKIAIPNSDTFIYGIVMDWDMGDVIVTLTAFVTGACSMYLSTGGGIVGGGKNPEVAEMAVELVTGAKEYIDMAQPVTTTDQPAANCIRFYFLTNHRMFLVEEQIDNFDSGKSLLLPFFEKANEVITGLRNSGNGALANPNN